MTQESARDPLSIKKISENDKMATFGRLSGSNLLSQNKLIDDDLTLNSLEISEASKIKTRKSQGLLLSCTQVNSSS